MKTKSNMAKINAEIYEEYSKVSRVLTSWRASLGGDVPQPRVVFNDLFLKVQ